jgi:hypothetical protein
MFVFLKRFAANLRPYRGTSAIIFCGLLLEMSFASAVPFSFKFIVDNALLGKDFRLLLTVRTLTDCVFLTLRRDEFGQLLDKAPSVRARLERILDQRASREEFAPLQRIAAASAAEPA